MSLRQKLFHMIKNDITNAPFNKCNSSESDNSEEDKL